MNLFKKKALSIKGSALLLVLSLSLAIGIISTALYQSYLQIEILAIKKNNSIELDLALESLVQYTKKGVSSLWCFDKDYWQDELTTQTNDGETSTKRKCSDLDEFLKHEGNVELLLADDKFKEKLRQLVAQKNAETQETDDDITTEVSSCLKASQCNDDEKWIEINIDPANVNDFPNTNPIKPIIKKLATFSDEVKFKISRLGEKTHNLQGRRWIRISVSVLKSDKLIKELSVEYLMYPRQISSYAFLSANELRLNEDVRSISSKKDGHTRISQINKSEISQYKGLDVFSPVYVNTNIVLPNKSTKFSPVHFKAPVILGKGILKRDETDGIKAFSSIDETKFEKKYYTSVDGMSGFSGGIEIRGKKDDGLEKLSDASISVNYDTVYKCVGKSEVSDIYSEKQIFVQTNNTYDEIENPMEGLNKTETRQRIRNHSKLMIKPLSQEQTSDEITFKYRLRLTPPNRFRSLPFSSKTGGSISGINNSLKSILSLRLFSWKKNDFNNSKKEDKVLLSWNDSFYYKHEDKWFDTPDSDDRLTYTIVQERVFIEKDDSIYFIAGKWGSNWLFDVWRSEDRVNWVKISSGFPRIRFPKVIVKDGYFYAIGHTWAQGGQPGLGNSVYRSIDGITWTHINASSTKKFTKRQYARFVVKDPYMYVIGGTENIKNDVWRSKDGIDWEQVYFPTATDTLVINRADFSVIYSAVLKGNTIYFIGGGCGTYAKVWKYKIGENKWENIPQTTLTGRNRNTSFAKGNYIYTIGGSCGASTQGLWRSIDGSHWEQVDTGGAIQGNETPIVKEDGSVHFLKDGKSKYFSPASTLLKIKTSPVAEEGFEDSYKNNEIDLSIAIKKNKVKNNPSNIHRFSFTAALTVQSGYNETGKDTFIGFSTKRMGNKYRDTTTESNITGTRPTDLYLLRTGTDEYNGHESLYYITSNSLNSDIDIIHVRKKGEHGWRVYNFKNATTEPAWDGDKWKGVRGQGLKFIEGQEYEVEIIKTQTEEQKGSSSITKNTKFVLDFLPYTLGSNEASSVENTYWNNQHKDFSGRSELLGQNDNDPSVFSALFKFEPINSLDNTYNEPKAADAFSVYTHSIPYGYGSMEVSIDSYPATYQSSAYSVPNNFYGIVSYGYNPRKLRFYAKKPLFDQIAKIRMRDILKPDSKTYDFSEAEEKRSGGYYYKEIDISGEYFRMSNTYNLQLLDKSPTGSLYHDKGVNLPKATCEQRDSNKGDSDVNYTYKKDNELAATNGKTDYSYTDWMTIGKSYYENTNSMKLCAYKSTEEDINGIQTTPCEENSTVNHNIFDEGLWEEDFLDYTKKSWNFFCSAANGDNAQVRRLSNDKEVCTTGSPNTFTFRAKNIGQDSSDDLIGFSSKNIGTYYKAGGNQITSGTPPTGFFLLRTSAPDDQGVYKDKMFYIASESLSPDINQIKVRKKGEANWKTFTFPNNGKGAKTGVNDWWKGVDEQGLDFVPEEEYEVQVIKRNESTTAPRGLSDKEYCAYCKPKETLCIGSGSNCDFTISNNLVSKKTNSSTPQFQNRGLYKKCVVNANADFVAGFFVCEEFYVASRTKPLNIIGTVVSGKIDIHKQALKNGVSWMSIFHPKAVKLLQANGILYSSKFELLGENKEIGFTEDCSHLFDFKHRSDSIWSSKNHEIYRANAYTCSPASLTDNQESNPFSWTQVNPDCIMKREDGTTNSNSQILCKGRKKHFFMNEISRYLE